MSFSVSTAVCSSTYYSFRYSRSYSSLLLLRRLRVAEIRATGSVESVTSLSTYPGRHSSPINMLMNARSPFSGRPFLSARSPLLRCCARHPIAGSHPRRQAKFRFN